MFFYFIVKDLRHFYGKQHLTFITLWMFLVNDFIFCIFKYIYFIILYIIILLVRATPSVSSS